MKLLSDILRCDQILTGPAETAPYALDWTRVATANAAAVVFPESTEDIQKIVRWARNSKTALVPSGGRTGLSGGAVAAQSEVVVSLDRMNKVFELNSVDRSLHVQAGVVTQTIQETAKNGGFYFPIDFASRGSSQIGGNISTNAGGTKVIRYGLTREWVLGLTVVSGAGEILRLNRALVKDNAGYDLRQLFIGSEGTLGFISEAVIRLTRPPQDLAVLLLQASKLSDATLILKAFQQKLPLTAFEFFTDKALRYVLKTNDLVDPFETPSQVYILIEFENDSADRVDEALALFEDCLAKNWISHGVLSQSSEQAERFWKYRESISESLSKYRPYKSDISVRISQMPAFVEATEALLHSQFPGMEVVWFGHIGDGNLHINVLKSEKSDWEMFAKDCQALSLELFALLQKFGGSISAEHGIGITKKPYLHFTRSSEEIAAMKAIKKIFDPDGILNPGKIFD